MTKQRFIPFIIAVVLLFLGFYPILMWVALPIGFYTTYKEDYRFCFAFIYLLIFWPFIGYGLHAYFQLPTLFFEFETILYVFLPFTAAPLSLSGLIAGLAVRKGFAKGSIRRVLSALLAAVIVIASVYWGQVSLGNPFTAIYVQVKISRELNAEYGGGISYGWPMKRTDNRNNHRYWLTARQRSSGRAWHAGYSKDDEIFKIKIYEYPDGTTIVFK